MTAVRSPFFPLAARTARSASCLDFAYALRGFAAYGMLSFPFLTSVPSNTTEVLLEYTSLRTPTSVAASMTFLVPTTLTSWKTCGLSVCRMDRGEMVWMMHVAPL